MENFYFNQLSAILLSLCGGTLTAFLFFLFFRPKVKISDKIVTGLTPDGKEFYQFKFYNKSLFSAVDVQPTLFFGKPKEQSEHHVDVVYEQISLSRIRPFYVPRWKLVTKKTRYAPHCVKIKCFKQSLSNLEFDGAHDSFEKMLDSFGTMLELRVTLKHGLSNLQRTKNKKFIRANCIVDNDYTFKFGNSVKVKKKNSI